MLQNQDYIEHYKLDAEYVDYFQPSKFEKEVIRRRYQTLIALSRPADGERILEIGSGGGQVLAAIGKKSVYYYPLDIAHNNLKEIRERSGNLYTLPVTGDAFHLPVQNESMDVVLCSEVLEHVNEPGSVLEEIRRVLKPQGRVVISVPYKEKITYQLCIHCNRLTPTHAHLHSFDKQKMEHLFNTCGLKTGGKLTMGNKAANRLYFNIAFKFFPYLLWRFFDRFFNLIVPKPSHLVVWGTKE
ncbi:MAG TPA: class I SAM-dependent methyltransferase [Caldithrix abyssi]|uniref:Class I SAM-dependent methyltransferase n=1 Tax=Caldithrix abyssi TaxID=187145 RepID=A0A7V4U494_CALAY|nr:class I SAM-dependent methyltransferase [Caldithrix abyssi]